MAFTLMPTMSIPVNAGATGAKAITIGASSIVKGDKVYFGNYSSDIKWRVLDTSTNTGVSGLFLISDNALTENTVAFDSGAADNGQTNPNEWQHSDAQTWCNTTFFNAAFDAKEKNAILATTKTDLPAAIAFDEEITTNYGTSQLSEDKVFFLSVEEANNPSYFANNADRLANLGTVDWWLRSPWVDNALNAGSVQTDGKIGGALVVFRYAARPAINISGNSVLFASAATDGKADTVGSALSEVLATPPTEWKLTVKDNSAPRNSFSVTETTLTAGQGKTAEITYSNAVTGTNEYISAMICSSTTNEVLYYGKLEPAENGTGNKASITIPSDLANGSYTLKIFNEQCNGGTKTDYSSDFKEITLTVDAVPSVTVGAQAGWLSVTDTSATATFSVTTEVFTGTITENNYTINWFSDAAGINSVPDGFAGVTLEKTSASVLTASIDGTAQAGTYYFKLTATDSTQTPTQTATSKVVALTVAPAPSVFVGAQQGAVTAGTATFAVTTAGFQNTLTPSNYSISWYSNAAGTGGALLVPPAGVTLTATSADTLTATIGTNAQVGTYYFRLTADDTAQTATSAVAVLTVRARMGSSLGADCISSGDKVYYGLNSGNGISWRVLSMGGNGASSYGVSNASPMFLVSNNALTDKETIPFEAAWNSDDGDGQTTPNSWQHSDAQDWCTNFFNSTYFDAKEKSAILSTTKNDNAVALKNIIGNDVNYGTSNLYEDEVFFLSAEEVNSYFGGQDDRVAEYGGSAVGWWLRSSYANNTDLAGVVLEYGRAYSDSVDYLRAARPAFNLNQTSVLFSSAALGGKSSGTAGAGALTAVPTTPVTEWKLTLKDSGHTLGTAITGDIMKAGSTISIDYTGATVGKTLSAVIVDGSGNLVYYGNLAENIAKDGTVEVTLPSTFNSSTMTLKLFTETLNGDYKTDYASEFVDVPSVSVGSQTGWLIAGSAGTATFDVTTKGFTNALDTSNYTINWYTNAAGTTSAPDAPTGVTLEKTSADVLTVKTDATAALGKYYFTLTATNTATTPNQTATSTVATIAIGAPLTFTDNAAYDIPSGRTGTAITSVNVSGGVSGGLAPYTFSLENAPTWLTINPTTGAISGTRGTAAAATTATVKVTDSVTPANTAVITIDVGAVITGGGSGGSGGSSGGGSTTTAYHFTKGANGEWESTSDEGLVFTVDGAYSNFLRAEVDGKIINKGTDYTVKSGSTIITLTPEYLKTLDAGTHKLRAVYRDGSVTTDFKVIVFEDLAAGAGIEGEEETLPDDDTPMDDIPTDADATPQGEKSAETTSSDENPATGNSLSGVFAVAILAITAAGIAYKKRRK